jgi:hypothetical protein
MERLDEVCGPANWRNEYRYEAGGAVLCGISIFTREPDRDPQWVTKWDGAENTDIEAVKGGLSNAMKRCGVQWGIGRYLYELEEGFAKVHANGAHYQAKKDGKYDAFNWDPPTLPPWALPGGSGKPGRESRSAAGPAAASRGPSDVGGAGGSRNAAAPSVAPTPGTPEPTKTIAAADQVWKGQRLGDMTEGELAGLALLMRKDGKNGWLRAIAAVRADRQLGTGEKPPPSDDEAVAKMQDQEDAFQSTLPG